MIASWAGRIAFDCTHAYIKHVRFISQRDQNIGAACGTEDAAMSVGRRITTGIAFTRDVTKLIANDSGKRRKCCAVQAPALRTMAMAEIVDLAVYLETNLFAFTVPTDQIILPIILSAGCHPSISPGFARTKNRILSRGQNAA
jgi:hypothetical protein